MRRQHLHLLLLTLGLVAAGPAQSLCLLVACSCSLTAVGVAFGAYNPFAAGDLDSTGNVHLTCSGVAAVLIDYKVTLGSGTGSAGSFAPRRMSSGSNRLNYNLYMDAARTVVWGDGTGATSNFVGSFTGAVIGNAGERDFTIYGRIPAGQITAVPGSYTDTVTVRVDYF
jgi:spore coat protein U-like protein